MKGNKVYTVYKTTNKINGKYYIGVHKTSNPYDDYIGSGKYLKRAIEKYGIENFTKEIIDIFETPEEAFSLESQLVTFELIESKDSYNLKEGGQGGFDFVNKEGLNRYYRKNNPRVLESLQKAFKRSSELMMDDDYRVEFGKKISTSLKKRYSTGEIVSSWVGRIHTEETKKKIGEVNSIKQKGELNSQYGTCWITKDGINKKIKKEELDIWLEQGYVKGRKF